MVATGLEMHHIIKYRSVERKKVNFKMNLMYEVGMEKKSNLKY